MTGLLLFQYNLRYNHIIMNIEDRVNKMSMDLDKIVEKASIWQSLFDECPFAVAVFNNEMKFFMVNDAFQQLTGFDDQDIIGQRVQAILPDRFKRMHKRYEKDYAIKPEKKVNRHGIEPYVLTKDKEEILVDIDLSYILYNSKIYYVSFIRRIV